MNLRTQMSCLLMLACMMMSCGTQEEAETADKIKLEQPVVVASYIKNAISLYVDEKSGSDDYFAIDDDVENRTRQLQFGYVHDSVHETDDGRYFACVDFTEAPDDTLDLDFYVAIDTEGKPNVSEVIIHKVNGVSRL